MQKKNNLIDKIVKKNFNNELERILEKKSFAENTKNTLLSILYKIEASYKDYEIVKKGIETKEEYISKLLEIIQKDCNHIKIIRMSDKENEIPENKTYIINKEQKKIIAYPIERKILYAIAKISNKDKIIKDEYFVINETISDLINIGYNINMVEPLRDFNGYSWTSIPQEIESIDHNLIYQNLRMIVGQQFLSKWVNNNEFIIDYFELFKENLENIYGKEIKKNIIELIIKLSILLEIKYNNNKAKELIEIKNEIERKLEEIKDKEKYLENLTNKKIQITKEIKQIDNNINNKELLEEEYKRRNETLPLHKKIFSMRILSKILEEERNEKIKQLEEINKIMKPKNFVKYKKELEGKYKYLKILNTKNIENEIDNLKLKLQKIFLKTIEIKIEKTDSKQEIENIIYDLRYYLLLSYNNEILVLQNSELKEDIKNILDLVIQRSLQNKVLTQISEDEKTNYEILKNIFKIRIIKLEDAYLKITKEKEKYFIKIFDEEVFEEKIEIQNIKDLKIKLNKKIQIIV